MKPFFTQDVLIEASREELQLMRVALSCWITKHADWENSLPEDREYLHNMRQLYSEITKILEILPF